MMIGNPAVPTFLPMPTLAIQGILIPAPAAAGVAISLVIATYN